MLNSFHLSKKNIPSEPFLERIKSIEQDVNYCIDIYKSRFNGYLLNQAKAHFNETRHVIALGPSPFEGCFNLDGGRLYLIKFTYIDEYTNSKQAFIKIDQTNSMYINADGEISIYDNCKVELLADTAHRSGYRTSLDKIKAKTYMDIDKDAFLGKPCYHNIVKLQSKLKLNN